MGVITKNELLRQVLEIAGTQAAIARKMDLPTSRIAELYRSLSPPPPVEGEKQKKPRDLKYKEIKQLAELYDIDLQPERRTVRAEPAAPTLSESELAALLFAALSKQVDERLPLREISQSLAHSVRNSLEPSRIERTKRRIRAQTAPAENPAASQPRDASKTKGPR